MTLKARLDAVERLEALVGLRKRFEHHEWAAAQVIAVGAGGVAPILTVDAGDESRVKVGDLAVDDRGVVGRVRSVSEARQRSYRSPTRCRWWAFAARSAALSG